MAYADKVQIKHELIGIGYGMGRSMQLPVPCVGFGATSAIEMSFSIKSDPLLVRSIIKSPKY